MECPSIYSYRDPSRFVIDSLTWRKKKDPGFSIRRAAAEMGLDSPELLAAIVSRKRKIKLKYADGLAKGIGLSASELLYLKAMIQYASAQSPEEKEMFELLLVTLSPGYGFQIQRVDEPELFSHWTHAAILSLAQIGGLRADAESITAQLAFPVSVEQVNASLSLLLRLGLLRADDEGTLLPVADRVTTRTDVSHRGAHEYYRQVSALASEAVPIPLDQREFQCFALAINHRDLPAFKELIRNFRVQSEKLVSEETDQVYQMNLQFFPLTKEVGLRAT